MVYVVREPSLADAEALGAVHVRAWQEGYKGGLMPDDFLASLSAADRADMWRRGLERGTRRRHRRFVAEAGAGEVAGFIVVGPAGAADDAVDGEVFSLNVDPAHWGKGAGTALLAAGVHFLAEEGFAEALLWVHPGNERARRFYEARGWSVDGGEREVEVLGIEVPELRYRRPLP